MSVTLLDLTERLVPISDFSQGKAGKIFNDVAENDNEYIILKNNLSSLHLLSVYSTPLFKFHTFRDIFQFLHRIALFLYECLKGGCMFICLLRRPAFRKLQ